METLHTDSFNFRTQKTFCHRVTNTDIYKIFHREIKVIYKHTKENINNTNQYVNKY